MKKTIVITMIVILLLNLICVSPPSALAATNNQSGTGEGMSTEPQEKGLVDVTNNNGDTTKASIQGSTYSGSQIMKVLAAIFTAIPRAINSLLTVFASQTSANGKQILSDGFTIYDLVMGKYDFFNIDFTQELPETEADIDTTIERVKVDVAKFYVITRNLSIAISLFVLIYIGIRMAISTVASAQAKYKKMLINWVAAIMIVFLMHFMIIVISYVLKIGLGIFKDIAKSWQLEGFEKQIFDNAVTNLSANGFNVFASVVIIWVLTWYQVKFFLYYMHRTLEVHFLVIVAPLVTITYPIDKMGDGKAQAFGTLIKELVIKSSMQLIHSVVYLVFIGTAGVIAVSQPLVAIVFFMALSRGEKITRKIFSVDDQGFEKTNVPFVGGK